MLNVKFKYLFAVYFQVIVDDGLLIAVTYIRRKELKWQLQSYRVFPSRYYIESVCLYFRYSERSGTKIFDYEKYEYAVEVENELRGKKEQKKPKLFTWKKLG